MRRIDYRLLVLVFAFAVLLDIVSTHLVASSLLAWGLPIPEVASVENNPIVTAFWAWTGSIPLGELLDFAVKVGTAGILLKLSLGWERVSTAHHSFIFLFVLAGSWWFLFFGFIHNTVYLMTSNHLAPALRFLGVVIFAAIGLTGVASAAMSNEKYHVSLDY